MRMPARGWLLAAATILAGTVLSAVLQLSVPQVRVYLAASPALLALLIAITAAGVMAGIALGRRRIAAVLRTATADAAQAAIREAAAEAARERTRFLMRLDHELKNPLTAIRAGLANLEQTVTPAASGGPVLASLSAQADRISRLAGDLRKLAELESRETEIAPVDVPGLLREVVEAASEIPQASDRDIRLSIAQVPWPLPLIDGDRDLLLMAVQNLVANAIKFSSSGAVVEVRAMEDGPGLLVEVADTGSGIPADEIGQVWQELARGRSARRLPGTGIGLALVRIIVTKHGGQVTIRSRDGQGTVAGFRMPARGRARTAPAVADPRQRDDTPGITR